MGSTHIHYKDSFDPTGKGKTHRRKNHHRGKNSKEGRVVKDRLPRVGVGRNRVETRSGKREAGLWG